MKEQLQRYLESIDALSLRERILFFGAVSLVLMAMLQIVLLDPMLSRRNALSALVAQQEDETKAIQIQIQGLVRPSVQDPNERNREKLKQLREELAQVDRQLELRQKQFVSPQEMAVMLEHMVEKNRKLQLLSLHNLPGASLAVPGSGPAAAAGAPARPAGARELFRHTVELSLKGSYFDLLDYLAALERLPQQVFWEGIELNVEEYPQSVLKLTVYTLSPNKSWLTV
jgi:MSHA biogenesis protein MshJ